VFYADMCHITNKMDSVCSMQTGKDFTSVSKLHTSANKLHMKSRARTTFITV